MWRLWVTAKTWGTRPSDLLGLTDPWQRLMLDEAVALFGRRVDAHVDAAVEEARDRKQNPEKAARRAMDEALGVADERARRAKARPRRRYRYEMDASGLPRPIPIGEG